MLNLAQRCSASGLLDSQCKPSTIDIALKRNHRDHRQAGHGGDSTSVSSRA